MTKWMTRDEAYASRLGHLLERFVDDMEREPGIQEQRDLEAQAKEYADEYILALGQFLKEEREAREEDAHDDREGREPRIVTYQDDPHDD